MHLLSQQGNDEHLQFHHVQPLAAGDVDAHTLVLREWAAYCNTWLHVAMCRLPALDRFLSMLAEMASAATAEAQGPAPLPSAGASAAWEPAASVGTQAGVPGTPSSSSVHSFGELPAQHCLAMCSMAVFPSGSNYGASLIRNLAADTQVTTPCMHVSTWQGGYCISQQSGSGNFFRVLKCEWPSYSVCPPAEQQSPSGSHHSVERSLVDSLKRAMERAKQAQQDRQRQVAGGLCHPVDSCCKAALRCRLRGLSPCRCSHQGVQPAKQAQQNSQGKMLEAPGFGRAAAGYAAR